MELLNIFLGAVGGAGVALGAAWWLARLWLKQQLQKELESYKAGLTQKADVLKTELSIYAHEQNVGLSRIDAQRSDAILAIWRLLGDWQEQFIRLTAPNERLEQDDSNALDFYRHHSQELMRTAHFLSVEVRNRAIYFDQNTYATIARCGLAISDVTTDYYAASFENVNYGSPEGKAAHLPVVQRARQTLRDSARQSVDDLRNALVREFRRLMRSEK